MLAFGLTRWAAMKWMPDCLPFTQPRPGLLYLLTRWAVRNRYDNGLPRRGVGLLLSFPDLPRTA